MRDEVESVTFTSPGTRSAAVNTLSRERRFYAIAAGLLLLVAVIGFRQFLMHGKAAGGLPINPHIVVAVVIHGVAMLAWMVLLLMQSLLIVTGRRRLHIVLGRFGVALAVAVVLSSVALAPLSAHYNPASYTHFGGARYFLAFALAAPLMFSILVTAGFAYRARPDVHRPMMLLATVAMMTGSLDRWPYLEHLIAFSNGYVPVFHWGPMLLLGALLFVLHAMMTRRPSRAYALGYAGVLGTVLSVVVVADSMWWNTLAARVVP